MPKRKGWCWVLSNLTQSDGLFHPGADPAPNCTMYWKENGRYVARRVYAPSNGDGRLPADDTGVVVFVGRNYSYRSFVDDMDTVREQVELEELPSPADLHHLAEDDVTPWPGGGA